MLDVIWGEWINYTEALVYNSQYLKMSEKDYEVDLLIIWKYRGQCEGGEKFIFNVRNNNSYAYSNDEKEKGGYSYFYKEY